MKVSKNPKEIELFKRRSTSFSATNRSEKPSHNTRKKIKKNDKVMEKVRKKEGMKLLINE